MEPKPELLIAPEIMAHAALYAAAIFVGNYDQGTTVGNFLDPEAEGGYSPAEALRFIESLAHLAILYALKAHGGDVDATRADLESKHYEFNLMASAIEKRKESQ